MLYSYVHHIKLMILDQFWFSSLLRQALSKASVARNSVVEYNKVRRTFTTPSMSLEIKRMTNPLIKNVKTLSIS